MRQIGKREPSGPLTSVIAVCAERDRLEEYRRLLPEDRYRLQWFERGKDLLDEPDLDERAILIVDEALSDMRGVEFVREARSYGHRNAMLMTARKVSIPEAVAAIRFGADNILTTPLDKLKLEHAIQTAVRADQESFREPMRARN